MKKGLVRVLRGIVRRRLLPRWLGFTAVGLVAGAARAEDYNGPTCYEQLMIFNGPVVTQMAATPNPTAGAKTSRVTATLVDTIGEKTVARATLFIYEYAGFQLIDSVAIPRPGDGAFDSDSEDVSCEVDVSNLKPGDYSIYLVGYDAAGERGWAGSLVLQVTGK